MPKFEKTIVIDAPPEMVFARISDPMNMMEDVPSGVDCTDIEGEGVGKSFKSIYKMAGIKLSIACRYTEYEQDKKLASTIDGGIKATTSFVLEPQNSGTKLTFACEYAVPIPLIGKIAESLLAKKNEREWDVVLANIKDAVEAGSQ